MIRTALLATGLSAIALPAGAETRLAQVTLGNTDRFVGTALQRAGYGEFRITERELARTVVETCRNDRKFRVSVDLLGRVKRKEDMGACDIGRVAQRETLTAPRLNRRLTRAGFTDVEARPMAGGRFVADACRDGRRMRMRFEATGERIDQNVVGRCRNGRLVAGSRPAAPAERAALNPREVRGKLRQEGYSNIRFTDRELPRYVAQACRGGKKLELQMNRFGEVGVQRGLGPCDAQGPQQAANRPGTGLSRAEVSRKLQEQGFSNVSITKIAPPIQATACRRSDAFEMTLNRLGEIINQRLTGKCRPRITKAGLEQQLRARGFSRLKVEERPRGFFANGCNGTRKVSVTFNPYGERTDRKVEGTCQSQTVANVVSTLEGRGARNVEVVLEGCFRDSRYRWRFNQLGDRLGRERIGPCN